jgi:hypothetical protein
LRSGLKRAEETFGMLDTTAGVPDANHDALSFGTGDDAELPGRAVQHGALAILGEVEKDLHQALPVGPNSRKARLDVPQHLNALFAQGRFHHDAQIFEQGRQVDASGRIGGLAQLKTGNFLESFNQRAKGFEILVVRQRIVARQILVHHGNSAADVADFVGDCAHQDP